MGFFFNFYFSQNFLHIFKSLSLSAGELIMTLHLEHMNNINTKYQTFLSRHAQQILRNLHHSNQRVDNTGREVSICTHIRLRFEFLTDPGQKQILIVVRIQY